MNVKQFMNKNKYSLLLLLFILTAVLSISASYTMSKYTKTVPVYSFELEVTDDPPVLYRGFITEVDQNKKITEFVGAKKIVMGSFNDYKGKLGLTDEDWQKREEKYWVQQESAQNRRAQIFAAESDCFSMKAPEKRSYMSLRRKITR